MIVYLLVNAAFFKTGVYRRSLGNSNAASDVATMILAALWKTSHSWYLDFCLWNYQWLYSLLECVFLTLWQKKTTCVFLESFC